MNTEQTQTVNNAYRRPRIGWLYLEGLSIYLWFRLVDAVESFFWFLTTPLRWSWARIERAWFRLKPWLARYKRRLLWSILALACLWLIVGGGITLYLWRNELLALAFRLQSTLGSLLARLRRRTDPVIIVATQLVEETPVPAVDGVGS